MNVWEWATVIWPWQRRRTAEERRVRIVEELWAFERECRKGPVANRAADSSYVRDMIFYAEHGRDRMKLSDDYVARVREGVERLREMTAAL